MSNFPTTNPALKTDYEDNVDDVLAEHQNTPNEEINAIATKIGTGASTPTAGLFLKGSGTGTSAWGVINTPEGFLVNGKIVPSVTSNNLTVALKTLAGNDPSATDPVHITLGGVVRTITSALSVTKNAGTNWANAGSAELATKEIDYFVYLGYNTTDGVVIGFSRIPYAGVYSDFSATTTNEKYCAISTITNATAGDNYVNIGRFAATLSAGAGYTWSVPTFTASNLIQRPIYETRWLGYQPVYSASGSMTWTPVTTEYAKYKIGLHKIFLSFSAIGTTGGSDSYGLRNSVPFAWASASSIRGGATCFNGSTTLGGAIVDSGSTIETNKSDGSNWGLGVSRRAGFHIFYEI